MISMGKKNSEVNITAHRIQVCMAPRSNPKCQYCNEYAPLSFIRLCNMAHENRIGNAPFKDGCKYQCSAIIDSRITKAN